MKKSNPFNQGKKEENVYTSTLWEDCLQWVLVELEKEFFPNETVSIPAPMKQVFKIAVGILGEERRVHICEFSSENNALVLRIKTPNYSNSLIEAELFFVECDNLIIRYYGKEINWREDFFLDLWELLMDNFVD